MAACKEWRKKDFLGKFWNGIHMEDEEVEDLEIRECRWLQQE